MFVDASLGEGAVALSGFDESTAAVLCDDEGVGGEEFTASDAPEKAECSVVLRFGFVGGIEEDDVGGLRSFAQALEECADTTIFKGETLRNLESGEIAAESFEGGISVFREVHVLGTSAQGLDADGSGTGVEVYEAAARDSCGEDIEESLAEAVAGGASGGARGRDEESRTVGAGDHAHGEMVDGPRQFACMEGRADGSATQMGSRARGRIQSKTCLGGLFRLARCSALKCVSTLFFCFYFFFR